MRRLIPLLLLVLAASGCDKRSPAVGQANEAQPGNGAAPAAIPAAGTIDRTHKGEAAPATSFKDAAGKAHTLAEFKGKPLLLNLWATWCAPCVAEMPALDALAGSGVQVVAVSQDLEGADKVKPFFAAKNIRNLTPYLDTETALSTGMAVSLPTSILYDSSGHEVWRTSGGMDWAGDKARTLLAEAH